MCVKIEFSIVDGEASIVNGKVYRCKMSEAKCFCLESIYATEAFNVAQRKKELHIKAIARGESLLGVGKFMTMIFLR